MLYEPEDEGDEAPDCYEEPDDGMTDVEADADTLASAGYGTDEDYGFYGNDTDQYDGLDDGW
jgi:hypothetical protein